MLAYIGTDFSGISIEHNGFSFTLVRAWKPEIGPMSVRKYFSLHFFFPFLFLETGTYLRELCMILYNGIITKHKVTMGKYERPHNNY